MIIDYVYVCSFRPIETFKRTIGLPVFVLLNTIVIWNCGKAKYDRCTTVN